MILLCQMSKQSICFAAIEKEVDATETYVLGHELQVVSFSNRTVRDGKKV